MNTGPPIEEEPEPSKSIEEEPPEARPGIKTNPGPPPEPPK